MALTQQYDRPAPSNIIDYVATGFIRVITFPTLDISANTYSASIKDRKTKIKLLDFTVISDATTITMTLTKADKSVLSTGDYEWDLLEKTPALPDGSYLFKGMYSLIEGATG